MYLSTPLAVPFFQGSGFASFTQSVVSFNRLPYHTASDYFVPRYSIGVRFTCFFTMSGNFSFSFSGDDIEDDGGQNPTAPNVSASVPQPSASAFPVQGKPLLPATKHDLQQMLSQLPSKVAYGILDVDLDGRGSIQLPRRELWDVRVQLMAEDDGNDTEPGLGNHDVKTGVYEGGFKSWESSVDLVKVLSISKAFLGDMNIAPRVIEVSNLAVFGIIEACTNQRFVARLWHSSSLISTFSMEPQPPGTRRQLWPFPSLSRL